MIRRTVVAVALGGALGAVARAALELALPPVADGFPWTTFVVNVTGSFLLALLPAFSVVRRSAVLPPMLGTGVLGGYTTLSAYSEQSRSLLADGRLSIALLYVVGTLATCLLAVAVADRLSTKAQRWSFEAEEGNR